ncbi:class I tRNA ligase family protein, partial [Mycoplasmopsis alligatoris]
YVCGPTVYSDLHIGNIRPITTIDLFLKANRNLNIPFIFVHNITDIDDKIINKAIELKVDELEISTKYAKQYKELLNALKIDTITHLVYVRKNMDLITDYIQELLNNKSAYFDLNKNVLFDVKKYENNYGIVSKQKIDKMIFENENVQKNHPSDFALWKNTNIGVKFNSSFGPGRPGWHTECSALIKKYFNGESLDIHSGGIDLKFPHHENENIQHFALYNRQITKKWLHCGHINFAGQKMSKSLGNVVLAKDFLEQYGPNVFRMIQLLSDITSPMNLDEEFIKNAQKAFSKIKQLSFKLFLQDNLSNEINQELYKELNLKIVEFNNSRFNFILNQQLKNLNKNFDFIIANTLIKVFKDLGFSFDFLVYEKMKNVYLDWQKELSNKNYESADKYRKILIDNELI